MVSTVPHVEKEDILLDCNLGIIRNLLTWVRIVVCDYRATREGNFRHTCDQKSKAPQNRNEVPVARITS